jgi:hypothetical protein
VICLTLAAFGGCSLLGGDPPAATTTTSTSVPPGPAVTLLDPGAEPRRALRLALTAGARAEITFTVDLHLTQRGGPEAPDQLVDPPATVQTVRFEVRRADETGADVAFEVVDAGVATDDAAIDEEQLAALTASVREVIGLTGELRVDPRGRLAAIDYTPPASLDPTVAASLSSIEDAFAGVVPVLPAEPVGRGARWQTEGPARATGVTVQQTVTYEITELASDHLVYTATTVQTAGPQDLAGEDLARPFRLVRADLTGTTTGRTSLVSLEVEADTSLQGTQVLGVAEGGDDPASTWTQELDLDVSVRTGES